MMGLYIVLNSKEEFVVLFDCLVFSIENMDQEHIILLQKILVLLFCVTLFWKIIKYMCGLLNLEKEPVTVLVTGAAGKLEAILMSPSFHHLSS